ncbi:hypothetical protein G5V58_11325 [Nocardioides anomalus]|uniref:WD40 repeat domain-containing protein n=1 Tax=Nocardioides anomalus TaxID=2712223 RepID=A0A6G6WDH4_9ACTN|nr:hypothetical protein [Nocardioides anomalus]QIG43269.1 hypothetical protein G5V58_11325 [Nocardioides anomalus]
MTERLAALLHAEADHVPVPPPPASDVLVAGRAARRRRTTGRLAAGGAVLAVAAIGVGAATLGGDPAQRPGPPVASAPPDDDVGAAFALGDTVWLRGGAVSARLPETVQALYPTSAGLLVRTNRNGDSDGGAPFHFSLVTEDGTVRDLGLTLGEVVPSTDPAEPYLAFADVEQGQIEAVVVDVRSGEEAARVDVPGDFTWGGWEAPPVALSGDDVYVGTDGPTQIVDWRTGTTTTSTVLTESGAPAVTGGRVVGAQGRTHTVRDAQTGEVLLSVQGPRFAYLTLSPDGRWAKVVDQDAPSGFDVYSVADGTHVSFPGQAWDSGWTTDGTLFSITKGGLETCEAATAQCTTTPLPDGFAPGKNDLVRVLGATYES